MSTIKSLKFDVSSAWDGSGINQASADIQKLNADIKTLSDKSISVDVDDADATTKMDDLKARLQALSNQAIVLTADSTRVNADIDDVKLRLAEIKGNINVSLDDTEAKAEIDALKARLAALQAEKLKIDMDTTAAKDSVDDLTRDVRSFEDEMDKARDDSSRDWSGIKDDIDNMSESLQKLPGMTGAMAPAIIALSPLVVGLGAEILGLGGAIVSSFGSATLAVLPFAASIFGTLKSSMALYTTLQPLNATLAQQESTLSGLKKGTTAYATAQAAVASTQKQINAAMSAATPVQQKVAESIGKLMTAWQAFQAQAEKLTGPVLSEGFKLLADILPQLLPLVGAVAPIFQDILDKADKFVNGNGFQGWVEWITDIGVPNLKNILATVGHLFTALGQIIVGFAGNGLGFTQWLSSVTKELDNWGAGGGYQRFADEIRQDWPQVKQLIVNVGDGIRNLVKALSGLGLGSLVGLIALSGILAKLTPGEIQAIAIAFLAVRAAILAWSIVSAIATITTTALALATGTLGVIILGVVATIALVIVVLAAVGIGLYELVTHWSTVWAFIKQIAAQVWQWLQTGWSAFLQFWINAWNNFSGDMKSLWNATWGALKAAASAAWSALQTGFQAFLNFWINAWRNFASDMTSAWNATWNALKSAAQAVWSALQTAFTDFLNGMHSAWTSVSSAIQSSWSTVWNAIKTVATTIWNDLKTGFSDIVNTIESDFTSLVSKVQSIWNGIVSVFSTPVHAVVNVWNDVAGAVGLPTIGFASGGHVTGAGGETQDKIPAMLSHNEYVMPASSVNHYGVGMMDNIRTQKFAGGGLAGGAGNPGTSALGAAGAGSNPEAGGPSLTQIGKDALSLPGQVANAGISAIKSVLGTAVYTIAKPLIDAIISAIPHPVGGVAAPAGDVPYAAASSLANAMLSKLQSAQTAAQAKAAAAAAASAAGGPSSPGTALPSAAIQADLKAAGIPQSQWAAYGTLIQAESGGNPNAYNPQGTSSGNAAGIAQVTSGTFAAYGGGNIYNPVDNLKASYAYIEATYGGNLSNIPGLGTSSYQGYATGTNSALAGWAMVGEKGPELAHFGGGETVKSFDQTAAAIAAAGQAGGNKWEGDVNVNVSVAGGATGTDTGNQIATQIVPELTQMLRQRGL